MARTAELLQAREALTGALGGTLVEIRRGDLAEPGADVVRQWPGIWVPLTVRFRATPAIETATAAPGEKRGARR
jgi:hypothetical protein